jgi:arylsulfatase A-like enzyme
MPVSSCCVIAPSTNQINSNQINSNQINSNQINSNWHRSWWQNGIGLLVILWASCLGPSCLGPGWLRAEQPRSGRPNILWMIVEDMSADFQCYGQKNIETPVVDALAASGIRFTRALVTAPICSTCRSSLITGRYQTSIGAQHHRSHVPAHPIHLPEDAPLVPTLFRQAGYHVNNLTVDAFCRSDDEAGRDPAVKIAKTDYNFQWKPAEVYDANHWATRTDGQPFFVQVQLNGGKYRGQNPEKPWHERVLRELGSTTDPAAVNLPVYIGDDPVIREDWAQYLDTVRYTDFEVTRVLQRLRDAGELERTVIFFMTDHGISHVRNKQFLYDGGIHVPLIVSGPGISPGQTRTDLIEHIDLAATSLALAGIPRPQKMDARDILAANYQPRQYAFAARDRADETVDLIRSARSENWKYIRNGFPSRPYLQPNNYKDTKWIVQATRRLHAEGKLSKPQALVMADSRPLEELYDLEHDPYELHNLADDPRYQPQLQELRFALQAWLQQTGDPCEPESDEVYLAEVNHAQPRGENNPEREWFRDNVELMLRWRHEKPLVPLKP